MGQTVSRNFQLNSGGHNSGGQFHYDSQLNNGKDSFTTTLNSTVGQAVSRTHLVVPEPGGGELQLGGGAGLVLLEVVEALHQRLHSSTQSVSVFREGVHGPGHDLLHRPGHDSM